jgi:drug/metabolite transporter (DMT)-like permease
MKWMFLFSALLFMPLGFKDLSSAPIFTHGSSLAWSSYLYMLIGATLITYLLIPVAQRQIRPTTIGMYNYLQPVVAAFIAIMWGHDTFSWNKPLSGILIFVGVYLVTTSKSREDVENERKKHSVEQDPVPLQLSPLKEPVTKF